MAWSIVTGAKEDLVDQERVQELMAEIGVPSEDDGTPIKRKQFGALVELMAHAIDDMAIDEAAVTRAAEHGVDAIKEWVEEWLVG